MVHSFNLFGVLHAPMFDLEHLWTHSICNAVCLWLVRCNTCHDAQLGMHYVHSGSISFNISSRGQRYGVHDGFKASLKVTHNKILSARNSSNLDRGHFVCGLGLLPTYFQPRWHDILVHGSFMCRTKRNFRCYCDVYTSFGGFSLVSGEWTHFCDFSVPGTSNVKNKLFFFTINFLS